MYDSDQTLLTRAPREGQGPSILISSTLPSVLSAEIIYQKDNLGITSILNYSIPENTTKVDFSWNLIPHIYAGFFQNLPNLTEINLLKNSISDVNDFSFSGVPSVEIINLYSNNLVVIRKHMFSGLRNMRRLHLEWNNIYKIEHQSFAENMALRYLRLDRNSLEDLPECVFDPENHPHLSHFRYCLSI